MPRPDARIPLSVKQRDFSSPLTRLNDQAREDELIASKQQRQATMDESTLKTQGLQQERAQQQIDAANNPPMDAGKKQEIINSIYLDTPALTNLFKSGNVQDSGRIGMDMRARMELIGGDTAIFDRVMALGAENPQDAATYLEDNFLPNLRTQISEGLLVPLRDSNGVTIAWQNMKTNEITPVEEEEVVDFDNASDQAALKVRATGGTVGKGRFEISPERLSDINALTPEGAEQQLTAGKLGRTESDTTLNDSRQGKLDESQAFTQNLVDTLGDVKGLIQSDPEAASFGGRIASFMENFKADAKGTAEALGVEFDETLFNINRYKEEFDDMGVTNARLQSAYTAAAYSLAARQNAGRVSEPDFRKALTQVGGDLSDPIAAIAVLDDVIARETRAFKNNYRTVTNSEFEGDFGLGGNDEEVTLESIDAEMAALRSELGL